MGPDADARYRSLIDVSLKGSFNCIIIYGPSCLMSAIKDVGWGGGSQSDGLLHCKKQPCSGRVRPFRSALIKCKKDPSIK